MSMSNAERQRRFKERQRAKKLAAQQAGSVSTPTSKPGEIGRGDIRGESQEGAHIDNSVVSVQVVQLRAEDAQAPQVITKDQEQVTPGQEIVTRKIQEVTLPAEEGEEREAPDRHPSRTIRFPMCSREQYKKALYAMNEGLTHAEVVSRSGAESWLAIQERGLRLHPEDWPSVVMAHRQARLAKLADIAQRVASQDKDAEVITTEGPRGTTTTRRRRSDAAMLDQAAKLIDPSIRSAGKTAGATVNIALIDGQRAGIMRSIGQANGPTRPPGLRPPPATIEQ